MRVGHGQAQMVEVLVKFGVVGSKIYQCGALFFHQLLDGFVVVALVFAAEDEYRWGIHRLQSITASVYVGGFRVVDVVYAVHGCHALHAMLNAWEIAKTLFNHVLRNACGACGQCRGQRIIEIVLARQAQSRLRHVEF